MARTALIAGASGLVGGHLLQQLLESPDYSKVVSVSRRTLGIDHDKFHEVVCDFDDLPDHKEKLVADHVFCCLGTTIKKAGSRSMFRKVDYEYPVALAKVTYEKGALHFILVSALGANKRSGFFYNRVKGEVEEEIGKIGFESCTILRPSIILGDRGERRIGEEIGKFLLTRLEFVLFGPFRKYRGNEAQKIAGKMVDFAKNDRKGIRLVTSSEMK